MSLEWLRKGYPLICSVPETCVFDLDLGINPYEGRWPVGGNHIITLAGIADDGNVLVADPANEHQLEQLEVSNTALGGGSQHTFRWTVLEWTPARGVFEMWTGQEFLALRQQLGSLNQQVQSLQQQLTSLKGHP